MTEATTVFYLILYFGTSFSADYKPALIPVPYPDYELCEAAAFDAKLNASENEQFIQWTCVPAPMERG